MERESNHYRRNYEFSWQEYARTRMMEGAMAIGQSAISGLGDFFLYTRETQSHE